MKKHEKSIERNITVTTCTSSKSLVASLNWQIKDLISILQYRIRISKIRILIQPSRRTTWNADQNQSVSDSDKFQTACPLNSGSQLNLRGQTLSINLQVLSWNHNPLNYWIKNFRKQDSRKFRMTREKLRNAEIFRTASDRFQMEAYFDSTLLGPRLGRQVFCVI